MSDGVRTLDAGNLPARNLGRNATIYWGICGLIVVETMVFATLISSYYYLRLTAHEWPPAGEKLPELLLPTLNTVIIGVSAAMVYLADSGIRKGKERRLIVSLGVSIVLALAFLVVKFIELSHLEFRWDSHAYGSIFWTLLGFHTAHVIALVLKTLVVEVLAIKRFFHEGRSTGVQVNGMYWYFVAALWLPIYSVLYLSPRLLE